MSASLRGVFQKFMILLVIVAPAMAFSPPDLANACGRNPCSPPPCYLNVSQVLQAIRNGKIGGTPVVDYASKRVYLNFWNNTGCHYAASMTSFKMFDYNISHQQYFDSAYVPDVPPRGQISVRIPECMAQVDTWIGKPPIVLTPSLATDASGGHPIWSGWYIYTFPGKFCGNVPPPPPPSSSSSSIYSSSSSSIFSSSSSSVYSSSSSSSSSVMTGCIDVIKETYDVNGNPLTPVPQFTFTLDNTRQQVNDGSGRVRFDTVSAGWHQVSEQIPATWTLLSVTPANGNLYVAGGSQCSVVVFKDKQNISSSSSSSSSSSIVYSSSSSSSTPTATLTIQKTGASSALAGSVLTYTLTVSNSGPSTAQNVVVYDAVPSGLTFLPAQSSNSCGLQGSTVQCSAGSIGAGQSASFTVAFQTTLGSWCSPQTIWNTATVSTSTQIVGGSMQSSMMTSLTCPASSSSSSSSSSSVYSSSSSSVQTFYGCVKVVKEAFDVSGNPMTPVPQFTFRLDGDQVAWNDDTGQALFRSIPLGFHTVTEDVPPGWKNLFITPQYGNVFVGNSDHCSIVNFKNKQLNPALLGY